MRIRWMAAVWPWLVPVLLAAAQGAEQQWYVVRLGGQRAGYMLEQIDRRGDTITTSTRMVMAIRRGAARVQIETEGSFVETAAGKPIQATSIQRLAGQAMEKSMRFTDAGREVVTSQYGRKQTQQLPPAPAGWLAPEAARRHVEERMKAGERKIAFRTLDLSAANDPFEMTLAIRGPKKIEVYGRTTQAVERAATMSILPGIESIEYVDEHGKTVRTTISLGGIDVEIVAADKQLAASEVDPPELLVSTLIKPDFAILRPRQLNKAVFVLTVKEGKLPDLPNSAVQQFTRRDDRSGQAAIDLERNDPANEPEPKVIHSAMIDGKDEQVVALTRQAMDGKRELSPARKAEELRRFVHRTVQYKDLSVGMASASEVARTHEGDCTEHAVLLAAMLKAAGIPARAASGLIYVASFAGQSQVMGYHMWAQAWLDGKWVDLDGTLDDQTPFDATHILLSTSNLDDNDMANDLMKLAPLLGNLKVEMGK